MRVRVHAAHVLPITSAPRAGGWVDVDGERIVAVGGGTATTPPPDREVDLGNVVLLPGLVNAHTHLELSHLHGRVPPAGRFVDWVAAMLAERGAGEGPTPAVIATAIESAARTGTVALADIGNTDAAVEPLRASGLDAWHFHELLGFRGGRGSAKARDAWEAADRQATAAPSRAIGSLRFGVAPHAPYSTAPDLISAIVAGLEADDSRRSSLHLAESPEELELLASGTGPWRQLLETFGTWDADWDIPRCSPVEYLRRQSALHPHLLVVHGTQIGPADLGTLAVAGSTLVLCARSNAWVGVGAPPVREAFASGVRIALGTDSLASVSDLDMFAELAALRAIAPSVAASHLLYAATRGGAEALGFSHLGAIAPAHSSRILAVTVPPSVVDVEEWLVSGEVTPDAVRWLAGCLSAELVVPGGES